MIEDFLRQCTACGQGQWLEECHLGTLGTLEHHRCRYCGNDWSEPVLEPEA